MTSFSLRRKHLSYIYLVIIFITAFAAESCRARRACLIEAGHAVSSVSNGSLDIRDTIFCLPAMISQEGSLQNIAITHLNDSSGRQLVMVRHRVEKTHSSVDASDTTVTKSVICSQPRPAKEIELSRGHFSFISVMKCLVVGAVLIILLILVYKIWIFCQKS